MKRPGGWLAAAPLLTVLLVMLAIVGLVDFLLLSRLINQLQALLTTAPR